MKRKIMCNGIHTIDVIEDKVNDKGVVVPTYETVEEARRAYAFKRMITGMRSNRESK